MRKIAVVIAVVAMFTVAALAADQPTKRLDNASQVIQEMTTGNAGIPDSVMRDAKCIAVIPGLVKGAFIVGGEHGDGVATCRNANGGWSAPAFFQLSGGSFGLQAGGQKTDLVMMIMNQQGMDALLKGHFKVGAEASGAAGPVGREASASGGWKAAILTYSRSKGAFAGIDLNGAELNSDHKAMQGLYGKDVTSQQALKGDVRPPAEASAFLRTVESANTSAAAH